jgi:hypothetical protein
MSDTVSVTPPGGEDTVHLRSPSFAEWHALAKDHRDLDGGTPSADLIARTVATCLADEDGKPAKVDKAKVMAWPHRRTMWVYTKCWETVLRSDDAVVEETEKNSEAGQE